MNATGENNAELTAKLDELISVMKGKEEVNVNDIIDEEVKNFNSIARNGYNPNWKIMGMLLDYLILIVVEHQVILME